jgi:hypothetical protein
MLGMKRMIDVARGIEALVPYVGGLEGAKYSVRSASGPALHPEQEGVEIEWLSDNIPQPTTEAILAAMATLAVNEGRRVVADVRNDIIKRSDWTELPSIQSTKSAEWKAAWAAYRQELRDLPNKMDSNEWQPIFDDHGMIFLHNWPKNPDGSPGQ